MRISQIEMFQGCILKEIEADVNKFLEELPDSKEVIGIETTSQNFHQVIDEFKRESDPEWTIVVHYKIDKDYQI